MNIQPIIDMSNLVPPQLDSFRILKMQEELGELAAAHLKVCGSPLASASAQANELEEAVDLLILVVDYLNSWPANMVDPVIEAKVRKWGVKFGLPASESYRGGGR